jgi:epoxyqueuosine reductase QueG
MLSKNVIISIIEKYITEYSSKNSVEDIWEKPLVSFANADNALYTKLKEVVSKNHSIPADILPGALSVIVYFVPYKKKIAESNIRGKYASDLWSRAYISTNKMIKDTGNALKSFLSDKGVRAETVPATHNFKPCELLSYWSHRHSAYIAGMGTFGINNMLITEAGCCGRFGSIVTDFPTGPSSPADHEYCLNKFNGSCGKCRERCVTGSLGVEQFDRFRCYEILLKNHRRFGGPNEADVCGKCMVDLPCTHEKPVQTKI